VEEMSLKIWKCKCGWMIIDTEYLAAEYDYGCPRCKESFSNFYSETLIEDREE
jgi:hypothetical protein